MFVYFLSFFGGIIWGSFLNVLIYRLPRDISIITPRSFCPQCNNSIPLYRNIPLISYIIQMGRCKKCGQEISISYLLVELFTGLLFILGFSQYPLAEGILFLFLVSTFLVIAIIDYEFLIIPLSLLISGFLALIIYHGFYSEAYFKSVQGAIVGTGYILIVYGILWVVIKKQTVGMGDIGLIILLGAWLGPFNILLTIFLAACLALVYWFAVILFSGFQKDLKLPFGTFLSLAGVIIYIVQPDFISSYQF